MSGYEVCRTLRRQPATATLPVILVTALDAGAERVEGLEAGADDFLSKPISPPELLARVRSLLRAKDLHDTVQRQAEQLAEWNRTLEQRVAAQLEELERLARLKRFLPAHVAERVVAGDARDPLQSHRRAIVALFVELRGLTIFAETRAPDEVLTVLREHHADVAQLAAEHDGTIERFGGDGTMVVFNDPVAQPDAALRAVALAQTLVERSRDLVGRWAEHGFELSVAVGVASGEATLGAIGVAGRSDYAALGAVTRLAIRLCESAAANEVLASHAVAAEVAARVASEPAGELALRGFLRPVPAFRIPRRERGPMSTRSSARQAEHVFRCEGDYWSVEFEGEATRLRDMKGMTYLAHLLRRPEQEVHALELSSMLRADTASSAGVAPETLAGALGDAGPALDAAAKDAYRTRLAQLRAAIAEAEDDNDAARTGALRDEEERLARELAAAVGLGGRDRPVGAAAERARVNVTRAISDAVKRIAAHAPRLARHLDASIRTGTWCSYRPPRPDETEWDV
jgi:class 3 adenylate cyclase